MNRHQIIVSVVIFLTSGPALSSGGYDHGTAYTKLSVSYVAVVGICVVSRMIKQVTRVLHMPQDDSHAPSKPIAPLSMNSHLIY